MFTVFITFKFLAFVLFISIYIISESKSTFVLYTDVSLCVFFLTWCNFLERNGKVGLYCAVLLKKLYKMRTI